MIIPKEFYCSVLIFLTLLTNSLWLIITVRDTCKITKHKPKNKSTLYNEQNIKEQNMTKYIMNKIITRIEFENLYHLSFYQDYNFIYNK